MVPMAEAHVEGRLEGVFDIESYHVMSGEMREHEARVVEGLEAPPPGVCGRRRDR